LQQQRRQLKLLKKQQLRQRKPKDYLKQRKLTRSSFLNQSQPPHVNHLKVTRRRHLRRLLVILPRPLTSVKLKRLPRRLRIRKFKPKSKKSLRISIKENSIASCV